MTRVNHSTLRSKFSVHSFDVDAFGYLSPARLAGYLQQVAAQSADELGFGLSELNRRGLTWVLVRQQVQIDELTAMGDDLIVETWPSGIDRWAALRDFRLIKNEREVGRALTSWFVLDMATRHPVRPKTVLTADFHDQTPHVMNLQTEAVAILSEPNEQRRFEVRFADIDANFHVTNGSYIAWALEAIDESTWRESQLVSLDIQYMAECGLGSQVLSRSSLQQTGERLHSIIRQSDQKELARAVSTWKNVAKQRKDG